jgi:hypothetical protein
VGQKSCKFLWILWVRMWGKKKGCNFLESYMRLENF